MSQTPENERPPGGPPRTFDDGNCTLYRLVAECASDFICIVSRAGDVIYASPSAETLFGYPPDDLLACRGLDLIHPDDVQKLPTRLPATGSPPRVDLRIRCANGAYRWMEWAGRPILQGEEVTGAVCVLRDAASRHAREEQFLRQHEVLDSAQDGFVAYDPEERLLSLNRGFHRLWNVTEEEVQALEPTLPGARERLLALLAPRTECPEDFLAFSRPLVTDRHVATREFGLLDGSAVELYSLPTRDEEGRQTGRISFCRDVTARRRAERELRARARQQAAVAALGEIAIATERFEDLVEIALRLACHTLDAELTELLLVAPDGRLVMEGGIGWPHPYPALQPGGPSQAAYTLERSEPVISGDLAAETRFQDPLLASKGMVSSATVVVPGKERHLGVLGVHSRRAAAFGIDDVHLLETVASILAAAAARQDAEAALARQTRELRAVFDASLDGMLIVDRSGRVVDCNPAACAIFETARAELLGRAPPGVSPEGAGIPEGFAAGGRHEGTLELRLPERPAKNVEFATIADILPGRHLAVLRDITERKQMQSRLALADRMISVGTLAAGVAHELNNPLAYVSANLSFVAEKLGELAGAAGQGAPPPAKALEEELCEMQMAVQEAREGSDRMRVIIRDLGTFSRGEEAKRGPVHLGPVLESCIGMAWNEIKHRATLVKDFGAVPPVEGSAARLGQVFLNLLVNAAQAIPEGGAEKNQIRVATRLCPDGRVAVEVADTGCGIPPENRKRIFDPFFTTKPVGEGTGLGLSICHNIVSAHGGELEVESTLGKGATFRVLLHADPDAAFDEAADAVVPLSPGRRGSVLVVDDEPLVGASVRRALLPEHDVTVVSSAAAALELVEQGERFDLVISDVLMPEMTGMDLYRELLRLGPEAPPVVFLTGGAFTPAARRFIEGPGIVCIEKPFEVGALREKVRACLGAPAAGARRSSAV
ncbi:hybrid sensor histidine kinase/response regulator [Anaeromyxobacter paludicola]|uniref:histidine kinase n=1 Tax=Anaeromyxobacter paludicola TaxID=2918171 RepID=A0ABN6NBU3_9BACT|nr:PAS domain S-box protein [Anaeromyxobacter paludicola]BDG09871.1 hypothetical protein AMPC_29840 [Anaeromyxobacter paludicola]